MGFFKSANEKYKDKLAEEHLYWLVGKEIDDGIISQGLYSKALAEAQGDAGRAKGHYIQLRVDMLRSEQAAINEAAENARAQSLARERDELRRTKAGQRQIEAQREADRARQLTVSRNAEQESERRGRLARMERWDSVYAGAANRVRDIFVISLSSGIGGFVGFVAPKKSASLASLGEVVAVVGVCAFMGLVAGMLLAALVQVYVALRNDGKL